MNQTDLRQLIDTLESIETQDNQISEAPVRPAVKPSERIAQRQQAAAAKTPPTPTPEPGAGPQPITPAAPKEPAPTSGTQGPAAPTTGNINPPVATVGYLKPEDKGNIFVDPNAFKSAWESYLKTKPGNYRLITDQDMLGLLKQLWKHAGGVETKESKLHKQQMLESIIPEYHAVYMEWYNMGRMLTEAQVTQKQIQDIFAAIDAGVKAGKNVDAPGATTPSGTVPKRGIIGSINAGWNKFKEKIAQSEPISDFDIKFDKLQSQLLDKVGGTGGPIGKALDAYKVFGQKYPKVQSALYYGLTIAAAVSGWGLGATAVMAALRTLNGLLQGERFSSAAWKGVKTMVLGAAASQIFGAIPDAAASEPSVPDFTQDLYPDSVPYTVQSGDTLSQIAKANDVSVQELLKANPELSNPDVLSAGQEIKIPNPSGSGTYQGGVGSASDTLDKIKSNVYRDNPISRAMAAKAGLSEMIDYRRMQRTWNLQEGLQLRQTSPVYITPKGVEAVVDKINEGIFDKIKQKFSSPKITKDKLDLFWRKNYGEYSTAESVDVKTFIDFLHRMGVKDGLIKQAFDEFKIPMDDTAPEPVDKPKDGEGAGITEPKPKDYSQYTTWEEEFKNFRTDGRVSIPVKSMIGDILKTALGTVTESKKKKKKLK